MNRLILLFSFGFFPFLSNAQFDYSVDFISSIDYTHVDQTFTSFSSNVSVAPKFNYRIGGNFNVKVFENGFVKSGFRYAQVGFVNKIDNLRWPSEIGPNGFEPDPTLPRYFHTSIDQRFIEIPVQLRYQFGTKKLTFYLEGGISPHIYLRTRSKQESNVGTEIRVFDDTDFGSNRFQMVFVFGAGVNYTLSDSYQLFFQPTYRLYPSNDNQFAAPNSLRSVGIEIGIRRGFQFSRKTNI